MKKLWQTGWRVALCALLLLWIFHSIFVNEARLARTGQAWTQLSRADQWRTGWSEGPFAWAERRGLPELAADLAALAGLAGDRFAPRAPLTERIAAGTTFTHPTTENPTT